MSHDNRLKNFHNGVCCTAYKFFGCHKISAGKYLFRVWAPHASSVDLRILGGGSATPMERLTDDGEVFELACPARNGDKYCYIIHTYDGRELVKADPYSFGYGYPDACNSVICDLPQSPDYSLDEPFDFSAPMNVYEVSLLSWKRHEDNGYYTYKELEAELVPYVKDMGYTHVEFMPITEFPYDGSWGYQVTGYFAPTARLGSPQDFADLIAAFHRAGIKVLVDWVPAHFPKDSFGLYEFDGQPLYECPLWDRMEHSGWGTRKFDFGRGEVDSFLLSSAHFLFDIYKVDGLRVDAVASMLYLDYDRQAGDFTPNKQGGNLNLEAIAFIKKFNNIIKGSFKGAVTVAEESTSFEGVTKKTGDGGLGFDLKWNMGWMNDVLFYCRQDPYFRSYHHDKLTFSLMYAFSERYVLPLSHDEVVHVKGSIVNKMYGGYADKFAGERQLLAYMFAHPGKKLNFMGYEVSQFKEWDYRSGIEFFLKQYEKHAKMTDFVRALNMFYLNCPMLYRIDGGWDGFEWLVVDDKYNNVLAFERYDGEGGSLTVLVNFSGIIQKNYKIGVKSRAKYRIVFNTDDKKFGGEGTLRKKVFYTVKQTSHGKKYSLVAEIPRLTCMYLIKEKI